MKEAAGEANMTVITIVLIAIVLGVGVLVVGVMMKNAQNESNNISKTPKNCTWVNDRYDCK